MGVRGDVALPDSSTLGWEKATYLDCFAHIHCIQYAALLKKLFAVEKLRLVFFKDFMKFYVRNSAQSQAHIIV